MQHLSKPALLALKSSQGARDRITRLCEVSRDTYYRWIRENSVALTTASVLEIIEEETGLPREQILIKPATKRRAAQI
jgi:hypothetical protein